MCERHDLRAFADPFGIGRLLQSMARSARVEREHAELHWVAAPWDVRHAITIRLVSHRGAALRMGDDERIEDAARRAEMLVLDRLRHAREFHAICEQCARLGGEREQQAMESAALRDMPPPGISL